MKFKQFDKVKTHDGETGTIMDEHGIVCPDRFDYGDGTPIDEPVYRVQFHTHSWSWYAESQLENCI